MFRVIEDLNNGVYLLESELKTDIDIMDSQHENLFWAIDFLKQNRESMNDTKLKEIVNFFLLSHQ